MAGSLPGQAVMRTRQVRNLATSLLLFRVGAGVFLFVSVKGIETYLLPCFCSWVAHRCTCSTSPLAASVIMSSVCSWCAASFCWINICPDPVGPLPKAMIIALPTAISARVNHSETLERLVLLFNKLDSFYVIFVSFIYILLHYSHLLFKRLNSYLILR